VRARSHRLGQQASLALYQRADCPDGICYPSRLNGDDNAAIYDYAVTKISAGPRRQLAVCAELARILDIYQIALV
jgi:hypothetical protein